MQKDELKEYFNSYTGHDDWTSVLREREIFANYHQTRIRINYTYYNSPDLMHRIFNWYDRIDPNGTHFDYAVMDDGSQRHPITDCIIPKHWSVYRIDVDHGWNNEGARNCLMTATKNEWNVLIDSDQVITLNNLINLKNSISLKYLNPALVYMPGNIGYAMMRNSFLVNVKEFFKRGGYDQCFVGYQGNDYSFLKLYDKGYDWSDFFRFARLINDAVPADEKNRFEEIKKYHKLITELAEQGYGRLDPQDKQDFTWTDENKRKSMWKTLKYQQIQ